MYIPATNKFEDLAAIVAFMQQFSFGTIINIKDNVPIATHLPFIVTKEEDSVKIVSHFALGNEQWKYLEGNKSLIIFSEPHAYISPSHYDAHESVPTWNYISVHAYGQAKIVRNEKDCLSIIEKTLLNYEPSYMKQWGELSQKYITNMMKGIVVFEMIVDDLQAKKKLSQNKTIEEQQRIIATLSKSEISVENEIASQMKQNIQK
jgi:transcriptional regulator